MDKQARETLKRLAKEATPGIWYTVDPPFGHGTWVNGGHPDPSHSNFVCECEPMAPMEDIETYDDKVLENAANPSVVLSLLAEVERLEGQVSQLSFGIGLNLGALPGQLADMLKKWERANRE